MAEPYYITTAISYPNGEPHIGHALEKVAADVVARYHRLRGDDVAFCMGLDANSQHVLRAANEAGVEANDEVLAATIEDPHPLALELAGDLVRVERARQPPVGDLDVLEVAPFEERRELPADRLDLGELGHAGTLAGLDLPTGQG